MIVFSSIDVFVSLSHCYILYMELFVQCRARYICMNVALTAVTLLTHCPSIHDGMVAGMALSIPPRMGQL